MIISRRYLHEIILFVGIIVFVIWRWQDLSNPYFWDELGVYAPAALYMHDHGLGLMPHTLPPVLSRGHPLLFQFLHGLNFKIFGTGLFGAHFLSLVISILLIISVFYVGSKLFNRNVGLVAALNLLVQPLFAAQSTLVLPEVLLSLTILWSFYFIRANKFVPYIIASSCAVLVKESALPFITAFSIFFFIKALVDKRGLKFMVASALIYLVPFLVYGVFLLFQKAQNGWYLFPMHESMITFESKWVNQKTNQSLTFLFNRQSRFLWTGALLLNIPFIVLRYRSLKDKLHGDIILGILVSLLLYFGFVIITPYMERYLVIDLVFLSLLVALAIDIVFSRWKMVHIIIVTAFLVFPFFNFNGVKFFYDADLNYREVVHNQKVATAYLEDHYQNGTVYTPFPFYFGLQDKRLGYLTKFDKIQTSGIDPTNTFYVGMQPPWSDPKPDLNDYILLRNFDTKLSHIEIWQRKSNP